MYNLVKHRSTNSDTARIFKDSMTPVYHISDTQRSKTGGKHCWRNVRRGRRKYASVIKVGTLICGIQFTWLHQQALGIVEIIWMEGERETVT